MNTRSIRFLMPMVYAAAIVVALLVGSRTVVLAVLIGGGMILGAGYAAVSRSNPVVTERPERVARRAQRQERRNR